MGLENLLQQRLDAAKVAIFDFLQAVQVASEFACVAVYKLESEASLRLEALARSAEEDTCLNLPRLGEVRELSGSFEEDTVALRSYVLVPDTLADPHFRQRGEATEVRAFMGFPLVLSGGELYGVLSVYDATPKPAPKPVIAVARAISRSASLELEIAAAIEATLDGKADAFQVLLALGSISGEASRHALAEEREAVSNATKIVSAAYGFDLKSPPRRTAAHVAVAEAEPADQTPSTWPAEVDSVVSRAAKLLPSLPGARIDVHAGSNSRVDLDSKTLERILANLLLDIWRSSPPGTPITVSSSPQGQWVEISVEDMSGVLPVESLARRAHPAGSRRIGLPIARALVEEAGGRLTLSPTEEGRRYVVRLPVIEDGGTAENGPGGAGRSAKGA